jgi:glycolate oxidase iron-sulfur subunit
MKDIDEIIAEASRCVRCGTCKSVCPSYNALRREGSGPRGRVSLVEARFRGAEGFGEAYLKDIKDCTLCASCYSSCPLDVNVPEIILAGRVEYVEKKGLPLLASLVFKGLFASEKIMALAMKSAARLKGLLLKDSPVSNGLLSRFSLPLIGKGRLLPELSDVFFLDSPEAKAFSRVKPKDATGKTRVAFFAGCGINYIMPEVGKESLRVLEEAGAEVVVPEGQVCCGMPALSAGDRGTAKELARKNLRIFEEGDYDFITTPCATCSYSLKNVFKELLSDESAEMKRRVDRFSLKVRDITELLRNELDYKGKPLKENERVRKITWHDPCHLSRGQGIREEPRELIALTQHEFKGMKHPCKCCGLGGGLAFSNYELSMEISSIKAKSILTSGADTVVTACPGCIVQLRDAVHKYAPEGEEKPEVVHIVEIL